MSPGLNGLRSIVHLVSISQSMICGSVRLREKVNGVSTNVDINFWMSDEPVINQDADRVMVSDENIITYTSHIQSYGWQEPVNNGYQTGKPGYGKKTRSV